MCIILCSYVNTIIVLSRMYKVTYRHCSDYIVRFHDIQSVELICTNNALKESIHEMYILSCE